MVSIKPSTYSVHDEPFAPYRLSHIWHLNYCRSWCAVTGSITFFERKRQLWNRWRYLSKQTLEDYV